MANSIDLENNKNFKQWIGHMHSMCTLASFAKYEHGTWYHEFRLISIFFCLHVENGNDFFLFNTRMNVDRLLVIMQNMYVCGCCSLLQSIGWQTCFQGLTYTVLCTCRIPHKWFDLSLNGDGQLPLLINCVWLPSVCPYNAIRPFSHANEVNSILNGSKHISVKRFINAIDYIIISRQCPSC